MLSDAQRAEIERKRQAALAKRAEQQREQIERKRQAALAQLLHRPKNSLLQNSLACRKDQQTVAPRVVRVHHLQATRHRHDWGHMPRRQTLLSARCSIRRLNKSPPPRILNRRPVPLFRTCRVRIRHRHAARFCTL